MKTRKQILETELTNLEKLAAMSDAPGNAILRTKNELAMRYGWSERMAEIRRELGGILDEPDAADIGNKPTGENFF